MWVIDQVKLDLLLDVHSAPPADIADFWARKIAFTVTRLMANGEDGVRIRRFADRAAFLAHFLRSLAEDRAWQTWYFAEFSSLRSLPVGTAMREALLREPDLAESVLLQLSRTQGLTVVTDVLSRSDEELIVGCCADGATYSANSLSAVLRMSRTAWTDTLTGWYVRIRSECPEIPASDAAGAAGIMQRLAQWARSGELRRIVASLVQGGLPPELSSGEDVEAATILRHIAATGGALLLTPLAETNDPSRDGRGEPEEFETDLGAVFLLAAVLLETPALHAVVGGPKDSGLRYLLYVMCVHRGLPGAWRDPALRLAAGLADVPDTSALSAIELRELPGSLRELALPADVAYFASSNVELLPDLALDPVTHASLAVCAAVLLRAFAGRMPALGGSSIDYLWRNVIAGDARIAIANDSITVHMKPRPLQIVVRMAGLHDRIIELPGCPPQLFVVRFVES